MDISGQQKTRWNCLPHQQQEALKFTWDHIDGGPIQWRAGLLYRSSGQEPYRSLKNVSKRTLRALVRHNCIRIEGYDDDARGALPPENEPWTLHLTDLGCMWGEKNMSKGEQRCRRLRGRRFMGVFDKNKFASAKQDWATPQDMFDALQRHYQFDFDLAADETNRKCDNFFSAEDDALTQSWKGRCWLNPPYGSKGSNRLVKWIEKAHRESLGGSCSVTMLIPARTNTSWWGEFCMNAAEICS